MTVRTLDWDSHFFGLRIGRADISAAEDLELLAAQEQELTRQYDMLYVFCSQAVRWQHSNATLVDEKTIYAKSVEPRQNSQYVTIYSEKEPNDDLYRLALVSGHRSRFLLDKRMPVGSFERLYRCWIEQSTNGNMADKVFVYKQDSKIVGMLTLQIKGSVANFGLGAVDNKFQGQHIGSQLVQTIENYLAQETAVQTLRTATQWTNTSACRWNEKNGFRVESITNIYHWWLR